MSAAACTAPPLESCGTLRTLLLVPFIAGHAHVLAEASVHPAPTPVQDNPGLQLHQQLSSTQRHLGGDVAVTSHLCREEPSSQTQPCVTQIARARQPAREGHHGKYHLAIAAASCGAALATALAAALYRCRRTLACQQCAASRLRDAVRERLRTRRRGDAARLIQGVWRLHALELAAAEAWEAALHIQRRVRQWRGARREWAVVCIQSYVRLWRVAWRLEDRLAAAYARDHFGEGARDHLCTVLEGCCVGVGGLPQLVAALAWLRGHVCVLQAAARGLLARLRTRPWASLAQKLPSGVKASEVVLLRAVFGKRLDVVGLARQGGSLGALVREHMEAARERPAGLKKASSAKKQRARKAAAAQYKVRHTGSQGSLLEIGRVLYCVNGWNQLPVELLRKRWMRGRSRALSAQERLLVNSILLAGAAEPGSDEEPPDDCAGTWARAT